MKPCVASAGLGVHPYWFYGGGEERKGFALSRSPTRKMIFLDLCYFCKAVLFVRNRSMGIVEISENTNIMELLEIFCDFIIYF